MPPKKPRAPTPIEALRHRDSRVNIPTEELREIVRYEEEAPKQALYARDPLLDPQLVWKGKDDQEALGPSQDQPPRYLGHSRASASEWRAKYWVGVTHNS